MSLSRTDLRGRRDTTRPVGIFRHYIDCPRTSRADTCYRLAPAKRSNAIHPNVTNTRQTMKQPYCGSLSVQHILSALSSGLFVLIYTDTLIVGAVRDLVTSRGGGHPRLHRHKGDVSPPRKFWNLMLHRSFPHNQNNALTGLGLPSQSSYIPNP